VFCCGCLPVLGLFKGILLVVPVTLIHFIPCTFVSLLFLPFDFVETYRTAMVTAKLGYFVKFLAFFLLPVPLFLWPVCVAIGSLLVGLAYGLCLPVIRTFDEKYNVWYGGFWDVIDTSVANVQAFIEFENNTYFNYLKDYRESQLGPDEEPFHIYPISIVLSIVVTAICIVLEGVSITVLSILKLIPGLSRTYYELWVAYFGNCKENCVWTTMLFPFFVIAHGLLPLLAVILVIFVSFVGFLFGLSLLYTCYKEGMPAAFTQMAKNVDEFDRQTNKHIYGRECSTFGGGCADKPAEHDI